MASQTFPVSQPGVPKRSANAPLATPSGKRLHLTKYGGAESYSRNQESRSVATPSPKILKLAGATQRAGILRSGRFPAARGSVPNCAWTEPRRCAAKPLQIEQFCNTAPFRTRMRENGAVGRAVMQTSKGPSTEKKCPCCFFALSCTKACPAESFKRRAHDSGTARSSLAEQFGRQPKLKA